MSRRDLASLTSLILSVLVADDALTASELGILLGVPARDLRPALLELEAGGAVVTSGRTSGTRYCVAIDGVAPPARAPGHDPQSAGPVQVAIPGEIGRPRVRRPKARTVPATLDLMAALTETAELVADGVSLQAMRSIALDRRAGGMAG